MHTDETTKKGHAVRLLLTNKAKGRLKGRCFRRDSQGDASRLAGNFFYWNSMADYFSDDLVIAGLLDEVDYLIENAERGEFSTTFTHDRCVGYESTSPLNLYTLDKLKRFKPNKRSTALKVKTSLTDIKAPSTNLVTVVYDFIPKGKEDAEFIINSMYPGVDIGDLCGNITNREERVFFDWNHPVE